MLTCNIEADTITGWPPVSVSCPNSLNEYNVAVPTVEMYAYAVNATLGDDVYSEPSTT